MLTVRSRLPCGGRPCCSHAHTRTDRLPPHHAPALHHATHRVRRHHRSRAGARGRLGRPHRPRQRPDAPHDHGDRRQRARAAAAGRLRVAARAHRAASTCRIAHDDFGRSARSTSSPGERVNGHAHCRALLLAPSACLNVVDGRLQLGRWQRVFFVGAGRSAQRATCRCHARRGRRDEGQDDPAGAHRGDEPVLASDQVLAVPAARPGDAGRLSAPTTTRSRSRTSTSSGSTWTTTPDLVVIQVYITSACRAYALADHYRARGAYVALGGLHVTSLPDEAAAHADTIFLGPGEDTWPRFLDDFRRGTPGARLSSRRTRTLAGAAADPPRSDQAASLPRAELDRRLARLPARLRLLLQGGVLRGRHVVLHADGRRRARRDRAAARPAPLLPRRSPVRRSPVRAGALRRHARHGPALAGGRHGQRGARARSARAARSRAACAACSSASRR